MNLLDERFHRKRIPWKKLEAEGYDPKKVMVEAQKQKLWQLARRAYNRVVNTKSTLERPNAERKKNPTELLGAQLEDADQARKRRVLLG